MCRKLDVFQKVESHRFKAWSKPVDRWADRPIEQITYILLAICYHLEL